MEKIRLGIIGMGNMGSGHLRSILAGECPRVEVTAFADIDPERLSRAKELCPQAAAFGSALDCPAPDNCISS